MSNCRRSQNSVKQSSNGKKSINFNVLDIIVTLIIRFSVKRLLELKDEIEEYFTF